MARDYLTLALALWARCYMIGVVSTAASAVRADNITVVLQLEVRPSVQFLQCNGDLKVYTRSCLLLLPIDDSIEND